MKHTLLGRCIGLLMALAATHVAAQSFPNAPVRLIVPLTAGSGADTAARLRAIALEGG